MNSRRSEVCSLAPRSSISRFMSGVGAAGSLFGRVLMTLAAARVHLQMRVALELADLDQGPALDHRQPLLGPAVRPTLPPGDDERFELVARGPAPQRLPQIGPLGRVEAEVPHAVGREPAAVARAAEGLGRGRDDPEDIAVGKTV